MSALAELAEEIGADERTLRRAAAEGTVRCRRTSPRRTRVAAEEKHYLRQHWKLLSQLRRALRTRPDVRLAVLYGSLARGDADPGSDLDLAVVFKEEVPASRRRLSSYLEEVVGRVVDVVAFERAEDDPLLLEQILDEGRVVVDRDGLWSRLRARRRAIKARARRAYRRQMNEASRALEALTR